MELKQQLYLTIESLHRLELLCEQEAIRNRHLGNDKAEEQYITVAKYAHLAAKDIYNEAVK